MELSNIELFGYFASFVLAISFTMKDIIRLRVVNFIGCSLFTAYGVLIGAWPVVITNGFIACVNIYFLAKERKKQVRKNK